MGRLACKKSGNNILYTTALVTIAASATVDIITAVAGKKIVPVWMMVYSSGGGGTHNLLVQYGVTGTKPLGYFELPTTGLAQGFNFGDSQLDYAAAAEKVSGTFYSSGGAAALLMGYHLVDA